ncbi:uncharacterized protein J4E92_004900 [Alternaria infectoria]|uniref:uncharacterized protein n=1 Tax=Alternaria infectoria TaxID=45303 RepID=UPI002220C844|nr:uncharacterized protein J4E92_004900 [Alternaria infectoria]KAI4929237.1 hypothetical protein J4E92_004900 [Alternaria infectoria]
MARSTEELEELEFYYVIFPTKLLPEEEYTLEDLDIGFTCSSSVAKDISNQLTKHLNPKRWECRNLGSLTKEQIMDQYKLKEEDIVEPARLSSPTATMITLYLITYPPKLPKKGFIPNEERCVGVTPHAYINERVKKIAAMPSFIGWKAETIECDLEDPIIKRYIEKDGGKVKIVGDEWRPNGNDTWATAKCTYTNKYFIAQEIDALKDEPKRFWYTLVLFLMNEEDLEDYKSLDGGCEPFREEIADGRNVDGGWIAKGTRRIRYCITPVAPEILPPVNAEELKILKGKYGGSEPVKNRDPYLILGSDEWRLNATDFLGEDFYDAEKKKDEDDEDSNSESDGEEPWATSGLLDFLEKFHSEASKKPAEYVPIPGRGAELMKDL